MENSPKKLGLQIVLVTEFGGRSEEHYFVPELLTPSDYEEKVQSFVAYLDWPVIECDCVDNMTGSIYTSIFGHNILQKSYFKFLRVNVEGEE